MVPVNVSACASAGTDPALASLCAQLLLPTGRSGGLGEGLSSTSGGLGEGLSSTSGGLGEGLSSTSGGLGEGLSSTSGAREPLEAATTFFSFLTRARFGGAPGIAWVDARLATGESSGHLPTAFGESVPALLRPISGFRPPPHGTRAVFPEWLLAAAELMRGREELPAWLAQAGGRQSCAVVGSGGGLRDRRLGRHIDAHDVVIRFTGAPVAGFEKDVGTKTTIRVAHMWTAGPLLSDLVLQTVMEMDDWGAADAEWSELRDLGRAHLKAGCDPLHLPPLANASEECSSLRGEIQPMARQFAARNQQGEWLVYQYPAACTNLAFGSWLAAGHFRRAKQLNLTDTDPAGNRYTIPFDRAPPDGLRLLAPQFIAHVRDAWGRANFAPSTGHVGAVLALYLCDSVDVYGFDSGVPMHTWHYYRQRGGEIKRSGNERDVWHRQVHNTLREKQVIDQLVQDGVVRRVAPSPQQVQHSWVDPQGSGDAQ